MRLEAILLCPGFTHKDVAELFETLAGKASVSVARGDDPSNKIARAVIQKEYYGK